MTETVTLSRGMGTDEGTPGEIQGFDFTFKTLELPWRDLNGDGIGDPQKSCITPGTYECVWRESPKFGWCYEVTGVKGRSKILIHSGNFAGDVDKGWDSHVLGCILLGMAHGVMPNKADKAQRAILQSRIALKSFHEYMKEQPFILAIMGV